MTYVLAGYFAWCRIPVNVGYRILSSLYTIFLGFF